MILISVSTLTLCVGPITAALNISAIHVPTIKLRSVRVMTRSVIALTKCKQFLLRNVDVIERKRITDNKISTTYLCNVDYFRDPCADSGASSA